MIRAVGEDDFVAIASITNHYIATTAIHFAYEPIEARELWAGWAAGARRYPWLVATEGGEVVGFAKAGPWRDRSAYRWTTEVGLYLAPGAVGRGLGRALYTDLLDELARRKFRSAIAGIALPNEPSIRLHRAFGFESVGIVRDAGFKLGRWHDVEFWQKRFAVGPDRPDLVG
ncbi:MAG TPA: GNAT family N-acetyltransferase [Kofleriaceae bacterium]|nr:GNAT family N-acetyltransferase [Kofleriaceae bacterium]